jgi:hypothetical protein
MAPWALFNGYQWSPPTSQHFRFDESRFLTALEQDTTIIAVIEMSQSKWLGARSRRRQPVCTENSNPDVVVMESARDLERFDAPGPLNRARDRRIFIQ